jgi:hypothetical protein
MGAPGAVTVIAFVNMEDETLEIEDWGETEDRVGDHGWIRKEEMLDTEDWGETSGRLSDDADTEVGLTGEITEKDPVGGLEYQVAVCKVVLGPWAASS